MNRLRTTATYLSRITFAAPAGTPRAIVMKLHAEIGRALAAPDMAERLAVAGMEPHTTTPAQFAEGSGAISRASASW